MSKPRILDAYSGAGGAARGYQMAGFHVTGVDHVPQPRYASDAFIQADALEYIAEHGREYDAIHASPPCQDHMRSPLPQAKRHGTGWMLPAAREALVATGRPWIIENVPGAPMRADYDLCGCMFDLRTDEWELRRRRWFEVSWHPPLELQSHSHLRPAIAVVGNGQPSWHRRRWRLKPDGKPDYALFRQVCAEVMGIDWMRREELSQAIPPAYTTWVGSKLMLSLGNAPGRSDNDLPSKELRTADSRA